METLFCDIQDLTILIGLALNALLSWWWADPVSSWILIPFLINEGRENLSGHDHHHDEHDEELEHHTPPRLLLPQLPLRPPQDAAPPVAQPNLANTLHKLTCTTKHDTTAKYTSLDNPMPDPSGTK